MKHFILASALLLTCSQVFAKTYVLKKGKNGGIHLSVKLNDFAEQRVRFDESSTYQTKDPKNQGDINKLFGFSDCYSFHQKNSARFGWRWYNDNLEIHAYAYAKGKRNSKFIQKIDQNKSYDMRIETEGSEYIFLIDGEESVRLPRGCTQKFNVKYKLFPYFGGDETAPHDIRIELD